MKISPLILFMLFINCSFSQIVNIDWQKSYGTADNDGGMVNINGINNDYILTGYTISATDSHDILYYRVLKNDGSMISFAQLGGSGNDYPCGIEHAWDGGYVLLNNTTSNNGDVSGNHGKSDVWLSKVTLNGSIMWQKCYGGTEDDLAGSIIKTADSCYLIAAYTSSNDGDVTNNHGGTDFWIIKIDISGNIIWQKTYGSIGSEMRPHLKNINNNEFLLAGNSNNDYSVYKMDSAGTVIWQKTLGGSDYDDPEETVIVNDEYFIAGHTNSNDGDVTNNHLDGNVPSMDSWIICLDSSGTLLWEKCFGGSKSEQAGSITTDGQSLFITASTSSHNGDVTNNIHMLATDYWVFQTDLLGNILWENCYGGSDLEYPQSMFLDGDQLVITGISRSDDGDLNFNNGMADIWILKLDADSLIAQSPIFSGKTDYEVYPNPYRDSFTIKNSSSTNKVAVLCIYDLTGRLILTDSLEGDMQKYDFEWLTEGLYILQIHSDESLIKKRLVKL
jgi:hypothetical protein